MRIVFWAVVVAFSVLCWRLTLAANQRFATKLAGHSAGETSFTAALAAHQPGPSSEPRASVHAKPEPKSPFELDASTPFYRLDLRRQRGVVQLLDLSYFESKTRPMPWLGQAEYMVVAKLGARVVTAAPLGFRTKEHLHSMLSDGTCTDREIEVAEPQNAVFIEVSGEIDHIELLAPPEKVLISLPATRLKGARDAWSRLKARAGNPQEP